MFRAVGIFQFVVLCAAEAVQWRLTRRGPTRVKIIRAVITYLVLNFVFLLVALVLSLFLYGI